MLNWVGSWERFAIFMVNSQATEVSAKENQLRGHRYWGDPRRLTRMKFAPVTVMIAT
jgi:hypothetical protein